MCDLLGWYEISSEANLLNSVCTHLPGKYVLGPQVSLGEANSQYHWTRALQAGGTLPTEAIIH